MNLARITYFLPFSEKRKRGKLSIPRWIPDRVADRRGQNCRRGANADANQTLATGDADREGLHVSMWIKEMKEQKVWNCAADGNRTQDLTH
jgi:hypothetical protein